MPLPLKGAGRIQRQTVENIQGRLKAKHTLTHIDPQMPRKKRNYQ